MANTADRLKPPSLLLLALEGRAAWEGGAALAALPWLRFAAPRGDGHPVLVFPGLAAGDLSTLPLRRFLHQRGYTVYPWKLGINLGPGRNVFESCLRRLHELHHLHGRKVSLVGWSLGGVYAREVAKLAPQSVRSVITLGTPFAGHHRSTRAWRLYELASGERLGVTRLTEQIRAAPPVPTTSIYSRSDGVVAWQCSIERETPIAENIEVRASHIGMGVNPTVLYAIADRLAQPEGGWKPFGRDGVKRYFYRDPSR